jgi:hypothetical protein
LSLRFPTCAKHYTRGARQRLPLEKRLNRPFLFDQLLTCFYAKFSGDLSFQTADFLAHWIHENPLLATKHTLSLLPATLKTLKNTTVFSSSFAQARTHTPKAERAHASLLICTP